LEIAGGIIAAEMGLMLPSEFNQFTGAASMLATVLYWLGGMLLFGLELHHWIIAGFQRTYAPSHWQRSLRALSRGRLVAQFPDVCHRLANRRPAHGRILCRRWSSPF
jgi:hypothetical protein